jgi:hypothetical protein
LLKNVTALFAFQARHKKSQQKEKLVLPKKLAVCAINHSTRQLTSPTLQTASIKHL